MRAIIPAKTHSRRCPDKNWRPFAYGKSLVQIAVDCAHQAGVYPIVVVDKHYPGWLRDCDIYVRPDDIEDDTWKVVEWTGIKDIVLLQPTSPLRSPEFIKHCLNFDCNVTSHSDAKPSGSIYVRLNGDWHEPGLPIFDPHPCDIDTEQDFIAAQAKYRHALQPI